MTRQLEGPLHGVRVVSFSTGIAAPYAGRILAQCGAEVIKVESRAGGIDSFRYFGDSDDLNSSTRFAEMNFGMRSLTLNLKHVDGVRLARELVERSDVVMDNFRADVLDSLHLGYLDLKAAKPDIIVMKMPGMGTTGPRRAYGTWGATLNAFAGLTYSWNHPGQPKPVGAQGSYPDYLSAALASIVVTAALDYRRRTGAGMFLDLAQVEVAAYALGVTFLDASINDRVPEPEGNASPTGAPAGAFRCLGKERWCALVVETDEQWGRLASLIGNTGLAEDPRLGTARGRRQNEAELDGILSAWFAGLEAPDAAARLQRAGIPAGVVQTGEELATDPQLRHRGFIRSVRQPGIGVIRAPDLPIRLRTTKLSRPQPAPRLGEHSDGILRDILGYAPAEVSRFRREKVVV
jgi:crotonobetainyl-CoA:carnitine CoA-transferase CaiB-like acyl-CoA transferase